MKTRLTNLFNGYKQAFDDFDAPAIAAHFQLPSIIVDVDGTQVYDTEKMLLEKFSTNCAAMKNMGYSGSQFKLLNFKKLGDSLLSVDLAWQVQLDSGPFHFNGNYLCQLLNTDYLIVQAVVY
ncbi:MAG TPA: hypothetical protein ENJ44_04345 [Oceanospirillales bacterium]|nr:hypothetical protein [Oceanospirillales bacterium]